MPLIEYISASLGGAVARAVLRMWLGGGLEGELGLSLLQMAEKGATSSREAKRIRRSFERLEEEIGEKLVPLVEVEFRRVPANEIEAAILVASETVDAARLDDAALFAVDLEPLRLERMIRRAAPRAAEEKMLSEAATGIYDFAVSEASNYIVEVFMSLPDFNKKEARELLSRESAILDLVQEVLDHLPGPGIGGRGDRDRFEGDYRREVARKLDRLELFGLRSSDQARRFDLSVAYIALTASRKKSPRSQPAGKMTKKGPVADRSDQDGSTIEELLASGRRHLVRGEAGSGKTTLLQWLAVSSARGSFGEALDDWNGTTIPFFIQLRRFADQGLPLPSEFPAAISPSVAERAPQGWVIEQMDQGRALVLIDGVDELTEDARELAEEWLMDLVNLYPRAIYVVTSRPPAVSATWLGGARFEGCFLDPMEIGSIDTFIEHWHSAAKADSSDPDELQELGRLTARLQTTVRENSQLRGLATSPLLCAMICALHRDWRSQLPKDRVELYRIGLEMLLERRDAVREVPSAAGMSRSQKELLLEDFAFWLLINGRSSSNREQAESLVASKLDALSGVDASPGDVLDDLLLRSGVVREPTAGQIDFIHRTFQEYLGAKRIAAEQSVGLLVEKASEDQWQEAIVLAPGLGSQQFGEELVTSLLERARGDASNRHRLQLLAVACLETAPALARDLREEIKAVLEVLIPPRSLSEAKAIASAGEVAIPMLAEQHQGPVATVAPSARALALIGGPSALATLERFGGDPRVTVAREILRGWDYFPVKEYAARVLSKSRLDSGPLHLDTREQVDCIRDLPKARRLAVSGRVADGGSEWDLSGIEEISSLLFLRIDGVKGLGVLPLPRDAGKAMATLHVRSCPGLVRVDLTDADRLQSLTLIGNPDLTALDGLTQSTALKRLTLSGSGSLDRTSFEVPEGIEELSLSDVPFGDLAPLGRCAKLTDLYLSAIPELGEAELPRGLHNLERLVFDECPAIPALGALANFESLQTLVLSDTRISGSDLATLPSQLTSLDLTWCEGLVEIDEIAALGNLEMLDLSFSEDVVDLSPVSHCKELYWLGLSGCFRVESLQSLSALRELRSLDLDGCVSLESLEPIGDLPKLERVDLRGCPAHLDPTSLLDRGVYVRRGPAPWATAAQQGSEWE